jgi:hypothetical protein
MDIQRPDYFRCNEEGSFALLTFRVRLPSILKRVLDDWAVELAANTPIRRELLELQEDLVRDAPLKVLHHLKWPTLPVGSPWSSLAFLHAEVYYPLFWWCAHI